MAEEILGAQTSPSETSFKLSSICLKMFAVSMVYSDTLMFHWLLDWRRSL